MTPPAPRPEPATPLMLAIDADPRGDMELAHVFGVHAATLYRYKAGSQPTSQATRRQIAAALGLPMGELWPHPASHRMTLVTDKTCGVRAGTPDAATNGIAARGTTTN